MGKTARNSSQCSWRTASALARPGIFKVVSELFTAFSPRASAHPRIAPPLPCARHDIARRPPCRRTLRFLPAATAARGQRTPTVTPNGKWPFPYWRIPASLTREVASPRFAMASQRREPEPRLRPEKTAPTVPCKRNLTHLYAAVSYLLASSLHCSLPVPAFAAKRIHTRRDTGHTGQKGVMQESRQRTARVCGCEGTQNKRLKIFR